MYKPQFTKSGHLVSTVGEQIWWNPEAPDSMEPLQRHGVIKGSSFGSEFWHTQIWCVEIELLNIHVSSVYTLSCIYICTYVYSISSKVRPKYWLISSESLFFTSSLFSADLSNLKIPETIQNETCKHEMSKKLQIQLHISILPNKTFPQPLHFSLKFSSVLCGTFKETNSTKRRTQWSRWYRCCIQRSSRDWFSQHFFRQRCFVWNWRRCLLTFPLYVPSCWGKSVVKKKFTVWKFTPTLEANKFATDFWWIFIFMPLFLKSTTFGSLSSKFRQRFVIQTGRTTWEGKNECCLWYIYLLQQHGHFESRLRRGNTYQVFQTIVEVSVFTFILSHSGPLQCLFLCHLAVKRLAVSWCWIELSEMTTGCNMPQGQCNVLRMLLNHRGEHLMTWSIQLLNPGRVLAMMNPFKSWSITTPLNTYYPCNILSYRISYYHQIILIICLINFVGTPTCRFIFQGSQQEPLASSKRSSGCASGLMESQPWEFLIPKQVHMDKRW